jgi:putative endonuclease
MEEWLSGRPPRHRRARSRLAEKRQYFVTIYYTYIIKSRVKNKTYTGFTSDINRRLEEHNRGKVRSSKAYKPYDILQVEEFKTAKEAKQREAFYKTSSGRKEIKEVLARRGG